MAPLIIIPFGALFVFGAIALCCIVIGVKRLLWPAL